jgi:DNA-binding FrmR family transcriptional regulator
MSHLIREKRKLINRVRRIRGQVEGVERALDEEQDCARILQTIAACRGAIDALMLEVFDGHIRMHVADPDLNPKSEKSKAAKELIDAARAYLK